MTLDEIRASDKDFLIPADVAEVLDVMPYSINLQCKRDPKMLGFPICMVGTRVRIPREGFLRWLEGGGMAVEPCRETRG